MYNPQTLAELDHRRAALVVQAERLRASWRDSRATPRTAAMGRRLHDLDARVTDYVRLIELIKEAL